MRTAKVACLTAVMISLASCSAQEGTLSGQVKMYGGPASQDGKQALNGRPGPGWRVTVSSGSHVVATTTSDSSGRFTFHLTPGTYTLCGNPRPVTVVTGVQTTADCIASVL